jgi:peroxiredoxin family protein
MVGSWLSAIYTCGFVGVKEESASMDLLLILRDALASSLVGSLLLALNARKSGREVGVLITQEALAAVARGSFEWPRQLSGQAMRLAMADRGRAAGVPVSGRGEGRQLDARGLLSEAREAGIVLYACPLWSSLLGLEGRLPDGIQDLDAAAVSGLIQDAKQVVGTL